MRRRILKNATRLGSLPDPLVKKDTSNLSSSEILVAGTLLDHQRQYAIAMFVAAHNVFIQQERKDKPLSGLNVGLQFLEDAERHCENSIRNYYSFFLHNEPFKISTPSETLLSGFEKVELP